MIAPGMVDRVKSLLATGNYSYRAIARMTGVSRATIGGIATGKRKVRPRSAVRDLDSVIPRGPLARCPTCGGRVYLPCHLCHIRRLKAQDRAQRRRAAAGMHPNARRAPISHDPPPPWSAAS